MNWLLRRLLRLPPPAPRPACRMSEAEALQVAGTVIDTVGGALAARPEQRGNGVEWHVSKLVIGAAPFVRIDDATGTIIESGCHNAR